MHHTIGVQYLGALGRQHGVDGRLAGRDVAGDANQINVRPPRPILRGHASRSGVRRGRLRGAEASGAGAPGVDAPPTATSPATLPAARSPLAYRDSTPGRGRSPSLADGATRLRR